MAQASETGLQGSLRWSSANISRLISTGILPLLESSISYFLHYKHSQKFCWHIIGSIFCSCIWGELVLGILLNYLGLIQTSGKFAPRSSRLLSICIARATRLCIMNPGPLGSLFLQYRQGDGDAQGRRSEHVTCLLAWVPSCRLTTSRLLFAISRNRVDFRVGN